MDARTLEPEWWRGQHHHGLFLEDALARHDIRFVFAFLQSRGWSQTAIAHRTRLGESRVRDVLAGRRKVTSYEVLMRICEGLLIDPAAMGLACTGTELDLGQLVIEHGLKSKHLPAEDHAAELLTDLSRIPAGSSAVGARLWGLLGLSQLKSGAFRAAQASFTNAREAAAAADSPSILAWVWAQEAYLRFYEGDIAGTIATAVHAQQVAGIQAFHESALAAAVEARAWAAAGSAIEAVSALDRARHSLGRASLDAFTHTAFGYDEAQLCYHEGSVLTQIRKSQLAMAAQINALRLCSPSNYVDQSMILLDRAICLIVEGDAGTAIEVMIGLLTTLTEAQRRGLIEQRVSEILTMLPAQRRVYDLREIMMANPLTPRRTP